MLTLKHVMIRADPAPCLGCLGLTLQRTSSRSVTRTLRRDAALKAAPSEGKGVASRAVSKHKAKVSEAGEREGSGDFPHLARKAEVQGRPTPLGGCHCYVAAAACAGDRLFGARTIDDEETRAGWTSLECSQRETPESEMQLCTKQGVSRINGLHPPERCREGVESA